MNRRLVIVLAIFGALSGLVVEVAAWSLVSMLRSQPVQQLWSKTDDQHLKTAVALIELHRVRTGKYPDTLDQLEFVGQRSAGALSRVAYTPAPDRTGYFVEIPPGLDGQPRPAMPEGFWRGTGYRPELCPSAAR
jgi:hypothetical protein